MWENEIDLDMTEIYRQNYEDALDEIRNLKWRIRELEIENHNLNNDVHRTENFILFRNEE